jgi:hypothetical protein
MSAHTTHLFLLEDLEDAGKASDLSPRELDALRATAHWIENFVAKPHREIGRPGTVCPFVPEALRRETLWLAPEQLAGRGTQDVVRLVNDYKRLFLRTNPIDGDDATYKSLVVVFTDISADEAKGYFDDVLQQLGVSTYADDGLVLGGFYASNEGTAIYNENFRPFTSPVPFLLIRHADVSDWKFFLDNDAFLEPWDRRFGESAVHALAAELRHFPWRDHISCERGDLV